MLLKDMNFVHRMVVRKAMSHPDYKLIEEWDRVEGEEYGAYLYQHKSDKDRYMVCCIGEDTFSGAITIGTREELEISEYGEYIKTALDYEGDTFIEKCKNRYAIPALSYDIPEEFHDEISEILNGWRNEKIAIQISEPFVWLTKKEWGEWLDDWIDCAYQQSITNKD